MTENELLGNLKLMELETDSSTRKETLKNTIDLLHDLSREIQQYRAIGTVEEFEELLEYRAIGSVERIKGSIETNYVLLHAYEEIGTIEEFKALKEKNEPLEPIRNDKCTCPNCGTYNEVIRKRRNTVAFDTVYCWHCGQALLVKQTN